MEYDPAWHTALKYLSRKPRTITEVLRYLRQKGFPSVEVENTIARLVECDYLNDTAYIELWVNHRNRLHPVGAYRLMRELTQRGIDPDLVKDMLKRLMPSYQEEELARQLAERKLDRAVDGERIKQLLLRRGFAPEIVNRITNNQSYHDL